MPTRTRRAIETLVADTAANDKMTLALAVNYGGRRDVVNAMRTLAARARAGLVIPEEIDEATLRAYLTTGAMPDPDLVIRTGGERRLSDFLLFECAHAELFFTETLWPDFDAATLDEALAAFSRRRRRVPAAAARLRSLARQNNEGERLRSPSRDDRSCGPELQCFFESVSLW